MMKRLAKVHFWHVLAPFGMIPRYDEGLDVWQFINAQGDPYGPVFKFHHKPSRQNLASLNHGYYGGGEVRFCTHETFGNKAYWDRLKCLYRWRLDPHIHPAFSPIPS